MTIKDMHYDFKKKLNKVDSQKNKNLLVPEIDWVLNEACNLFIDLIAEPRKKSHLGFEVSQRNIDDIRTLVVDNKCLNINNNIAELPEDYRYFLKFSKVIASKGNCSNVRMKVNLMQHDDDFENSEFDKSSFLWREVCVLFIDKGIKIYNDDFDINQFCINYIKNPPYMHNAEDFRQTGYKKPGSTILLQGTQDCILPIQTHRQIVDLAVMITSGEINTKDLNIKDAKFKLNLE